MLGINMNVDIDVKKVVSPIYFQHRNECTRCGAKGQLVFVDKYGNECNREVHALEHIRCRKCGKVFSILWERKEGTGKMMPSAIDTNIAIDFNNLLNYCNLSRNGDKKLY